jgi:RNA polymerase sigma factor (sigma-70 family)
MTIPLHSDKVLWRALKRGKRDALDVIFRTHYPALHTYGFKIYSDEGFIEDCLQDFFLYLFDRRDRLADVENIKPYLFKSFRRSLIRRLGKRRMEKRKEEAFASQNQLGNIQFSVDELIIEQEKEAFREAMLLDMLNRLPGQQREVILLRYYHGLSIKEVADVMNITYQGVVNTLYKAMKALRQNETLKRIIAFLSIPILLQGFIFFPF